MSEFLNRDKDLLASIASIAAIISFFYVFLAALASRKQNILKTAPLLSLRYENGELTLTNLNEQFAHKFESEPFIHLTP